jgi:hypothetical protein
MRVLGTTGVRVSPLCLGAMMFGSWGNPDHEEPVRIIRRALDAGINAAVSEEIDGRAAAANAAVSEEVNSRAAAAIS